MLLKWVIGEVTKIRLIILKTHLNKLLIILTFSISKKKQKITLKDIYEDIKKQVNRYKQIMRNSRDIELNETEETRIKKIT